MNINLLRVNSPGKINLGLKILEKRDDNYHNIRSVFCQIKFTDVITFKKSSTFKLTASGINVPTDSSNLIIKAYKMMSGLKDKLKNSYHIHLEKNIPIGAGLGGGSSNAASTITALNKLWNLNLSDKEMISISRKLGADVPFFINGKVQFAEGIGEKLKPIDSSFLKNKKVLLVCPNYSISTSWAYKNINKYLDFDNKFDNLCTLIKPINWQSFENGFEKVVKSTYPETAEIINNLRCADALYAGLSGSGSTVFGIFNVNIDLSCIQKKFPNSYRTIETCFVL